MQQTHSQKNTKEDTVKLWNIKNIISEKNSTLAKLIPGILFKKIEKILRQDEVNELMIQLKHYRNFEWFEEGLKKLNVEIKIIGEENIPRSGRNAFIANHPTGNLDGMAYFTIIGHYFDAAQSISNSFLDFFPNIKDMYVPVNMLSGRSKGSLNAIESLYKSNAQVLHFPAGMVSRRFDGTIKDLEWKKSFVTKSIQHQRTIVPAYISGRNSEFFYRISSLRRKVGIKRPFELFFLIDEMFKHQGDTLTFTFGTPIGYSQLTKDRKHAEWMGIIREYVYSLKKQPTRSFDEFMHESVREESGIT